MVIAIEAAGAMVSAVLTGFIALLGAAQSALAWLAFSCRLGVGGGLPEIEVMLCPPPAPAPARRGVGMLERAPELGPVTPESLRDGAREGVPLAADAAALVKAGCCIAQPKPALQLLHRENPSKMQGCWCWGYQAKWGPLFICPPA